MATDNNSPIGIFDSGIGGLTVVKSILKTLPNEHVIYFGDTARVPYGIKSAKTVREYALQITDFLLTRNVKTVLIACNTVASVAVADIIERCGNIPVLDVLTAGTQRAVAIPHKNKRIGVIGTLATIGSGAYETSLKKLSPDSSVFSKACPLLVPLAEEGWTDNEVADNVLRIYLEEVQQHNIDSLILGCTHYPLFKNSIQRILNGDHIEIIDSADSIADMTKTMLTERNLLSTHTQPHFDCYVSDKPQRFQELAERFLGQKLKGVETISLT